MIGTLLAELFWVGLVPLAAAATAMYVARRLGLRPRAAWAASVGAGYVVGQLGLVSRAGFAQAVAGIAMPHEARDWLPWAVALAAGTSVWVAQAASSRWVGHVLAVVITIAAPTRLLGGSIYLVSRWSAGERVGYLVLLAAAMGLVWWLLEASRDDDQPLVRGLLLIYVAVGSAVALTLSGSFAYGELCGVVAAALTGALISGVVRPGVLKHASPDGLRGAAGPVTMSLGSLILLSYFYAELAGSDAALLVVALVTAGGRLPAVGPAGGGWRAAVRALLCIVPMALAVAGAYADTLSESASPY